MPEPHVPSHSPFFVELVQGETYHWCACGRSESQPFCDGSHEGTGFEPLEYVHDRQTNQFSLCGCKHTKTPPICDGAHRELMATAEAEREQRFPSGKPARDEHTADTTFGVCVPDLPVKDCPAAIRYYADVLGFEKIFDDALIGFDHTMYACMGRGSFRLTLDEHRAGETDKKIDMSVDVSDVDALFAELSARGAKIVEGLTDRVWQARDFAVQDLDGHKISFTMNLKKPDA